MLTLSVKIREITGKKVKTLRQKNVLPAILYGPEIKNLNLTIDLKEFEKIYEEAGESSIINLKVENKKEKPDEIPAMIKEVVSDSLTQKFLHVDFYQPRLKEKIEVTIPLVFEGEAPAVRELGGVLVKNISEIEVKALPQNLPKEIKVDVSGLMTFDDYIEVKDLKLPSEVEVLKDATEVVALVTPPEKEEIVEPAAGEITEAEKVEKKKEEEVEGEKK